MRAAAVAFVLVAGAAVVLWFGNTLNSWVLGGLIGGLAALLLSIPISLSLFSFLSRRHDEYFRAELQARMALETAHQLPSSPTRATRQRLLPQEEGWRGESRYTHVAADDDLLAEEEWEFAEGESETDSNGGYITFDDEESEEASMSSQKSASIPLSSRLSRSLSQEIPARSPSSASSSRARSTGRNSSALHPQTRAEGLRSQPLPGGSRVPPGSAGPAYPGMLRSQASVQRRQSQYFAEALRTARLEAIRQQEVAFDEENVEVSAMLPPPPPRLAARRSSALSGQLPTSTAGLPPSASQRQPQRSQSLARPERSVSSATATPSPMAGRRPPLSSFEADEDYGDSVATTRAERDTFASSSSSVSGSSLRRGRVTGEQRLLRGSPSGSLRNPLVRRPPYLYEDDPLRAELSQFAEEPITRRSSRLRRFPVPDET
ncbi:hypothetical protein [Thermogemmatispora sp.]|uniref:hypothetical protein n=1 Tax=Thermogemmatispora sp. TaxID=1968838 RepID=UPI001D5292BA|nr:hypothetical protein [Thermogemmatispora sp.]MBX5449875.1 hypothetical protein [Thermogemmatispora sp.]